MSTTTNRRFTPASLQAFSAAARDLAAAYGLKLSAAQEQLARLYGFEDFHELRAHLAKTPPAGPYADEVDVGTALARMTGNALTERDGTVLWPVGRRGVEDLALHDRAHVRRTWMRFQDAIDRELDPEFVSPETNLPVDEYATFLVEDAESLGSDRDEGKFAQTALGRRVWEALTYVTKGFDDLQDAEARQCVAEEVIRIMENHPNNPYPGAVLIGLYVANREWSRSAAEVRQAQWLVPIAQRSVDLFAALVPTGFRGEIEPKLVGHWLENYSYSSVLYFGGIAAEVAGQAALAKRWWTRCRRACRRDPFGARFALGASRCEDED